MSNVLQLCKTLGFHVWLYKVHCMRIVGTLWKWLEEQLIYCWFKIQIILYAPHKSNAIISHFPSLFSSSWIIHVLILLILYNYILISQLWFLIIYLIEILSMQLTNNIQIWEKENLGVQESTFFNIFCFYSLVLKNHKRAYV